MAGVLGAYRQALRDLPQRSGWPLDVRWPAPPVAA
ncbi:phage tail assembly chaperone [Burkholderia stagnalis]